MFYRTTEKMTKRQNKRESPVSPRSPPPPPPPPPPPVAIGTPPAIVLADPPKGRLRVRSEPARPRQDDQLERALELSRMSLNEEERDLRLAIELSLADSATSPATSSKKDEEYSSVVQRVPNKSVEDLTPAAFGLVKDLHVSNILHTDNDKTKDFKDKDFSQVFVKYASPTDMNAVFEPRPPQSPYSPRAPDPWHDQPASDASWDPLNSHSPRGHDRHSPRLSETWQRDGGSAERQSPRFTDPWQRDPCLMERQPSPRRIDPWEQRPSPSQQQHLSPRVTDPADIHVDSQMLESLLQGAERYHPPPPTTPPPQGTNDPHLYQPEEEEEEEEEEELIHREPAPPDNEHVILLPPNRQDDNDDAVFV